jgi:XTP/dITP diphosphohydrolase
MTPELVLATRYRNKVIDFVAILGDLGATIHILDEFTDAPDVVEDGDTCEANAVKKARAVAEFTGLPAVADDTGLEVDALGGWLGVYAAVMLAKTPPTKTTAENCCRNYPGVPQERRTARFLTVAAFALPLSDMQGAIGQLQGLITEEPAGSQGFRYDPVVLVPELRKTVAELPADEKTAAAIGH